MKKEKHHSLLILLAFLFLSLLVYPISADQQKTTVIVLEFTAKGVDQDKINALRKVLCNEIKQTGLFTVTKLTNQKMEKVLEKLISQGTIQPEYSADICLAEVANALGAVKIITGDVRKLGKTYEINLRLVESFSTGSKKRNSVQWVCGEKILPLKIREYGLKLLNVTEKSYSVYPGSKSSKVKTSDLHNAVKHGDLAALLQLINAGTDLNTLSLKGYTPLHLAVMNDHKAIVELLLESGSYINALDRLSMTPLHLAAQKGNKSVVQLLIQHRANLKVANKYGNTPLHEAVINGHMNVVKLLDRYEKMR